jgi:hypothetical protein
MAGKIKTIVFGLCGLEQSNIKNNSEMERHISATTQYIQLGLEVSSMRDNILKCEDGNKRDCRAVSELNRLFTLKNIAGTLSSAI